MGKGKTPLLISYAAGFYFYRIRISAIKWGPGNLWSRTPRHLVLI